MPRAARTATRRFRFVLYLAWLSGCGGGASVRATEPARRVDLELVRRGNGPLPDRALIARQTGAMLLLSLWIDAGARDADPPALATLAAWVAEAAAGPGIEARAWPDAIELSMTCKQSELDSCLGRLARGVSAAAITPSQLEGLRQRLVEARRAALAADPARSADRLALEALFRERASGLFPLGRQEDDVAVSLARLQAFVRDECGSGRLLLVGVGEIETEAFTRGIEKAFARVPAARKPRAPRRVALPTEDGVRVGVENSAALSVAISARDLAQAYAASAAVRQHLERDAIALGVHGDVFGIEGRALALLRVNTREPLAVVRALGVEIARLRHEGVPAQALPAAREDLHGLSRTLASRWLTGDTADAAPLALGIGMVVSGARSDRVHGDDPDEELAAHTQERADAELAAGLALAEPRTHGPSDASSASVTLDNGARIEVRQRASEHVAIALRFGRGAGEEPPLLHGRAALLATLGVTACAGFGAGELEARLQALGSQLEARVAPESWGLLLTTPASNWQAGLALAVDCGLHPALDRAALTAARLRLRERLGSAFGREALRASAAELLWPSAPGQLAPWGSPVRQAAVSLPTLRELWRESSRPREVALAVVGPMNAQEAVEWGARRLSQLADEAPIADSPTPQAPPTPSEAPRPIAQPSFGLALFRTNAAAGSDAAGAVGFAALMRAALVHATGVDASWHDGGVTSDGGWAAIALGGPPEQLAYVSSHLRDFAGNLGKDSLERASDRAFALAERERSANAADPAAEAESLARAPFHPLASVGSRESARALALRLAQAEPIWLPLR